MSTNHDRAPEQLMQDAHLFKAIEAEYARFASQDPFMARELPLLAERNRFSFYGSLNPVWLMDHAERAGLTMLLALIKPRVVIEIGTRFAGSACLFSRFAEKVYCIDVMTCLERIAPYLVPGGRIVIDDYDSWSGCRKAVDEYFSDKRDRYEFVRKSRLHTVRTRA